MINATIELLNGFHCQLRNEDGSPLFLYHYTKFDSAIKILASGNLFMCSLEKQNDPWEFLTRDDTGVVNNGGSFEKTAQDLRDHDHAIEERKNYVRQASFSVDIEKRHGWNLTRMWAQYADNHAGVCLIFDYKQLCDDFNAMFAGEETPHFERPIKYVSLYELDLLEDKYWEPTATFLNDNYIDLLFTKHDDYEHEQEYRFLAVNNSLKTSDENLYLPIKNSFCGLITGKRFELGYDKNMKDLRMKYLRDAMTLCNRDIRPFMMYPNGFSEPLVEPVAERERHNYET